MNDADSSEINNEKQERPSRYSSMQESQLEVLAVAAIREHRHLIAADEAVYEEWTRASGDPSVSGAVLKSLQDEYVARQNKSEAQQEVLSEIIDALGYIPEVAPDGEE
ncbi:MULTISPECIES: transcriptional repressor TraM [Rhizobium]|uniref:Putative transcriptional repressor TraM n=1 Tax=Rhizobium leguminosarum TaxID=384 RepID=A0A2K9ZHJ8_RHILE|nr:MULTISPECIES: transcriptional repressor TraM [Rhizobium]AUW47699.1 putative transcriptional repressor TraM [Rhizobium leguminosarum]MBX5159649.1 transcriptional regulator [Rhizobium sp. NZLR8]MBY2925879.1 transcriptional regulator [Rhizobium leguminosarum]MBY2937472.1 transcriptional regulator [Rhizobium leguminosarum]MBY5487074.1 transcriptional regulator [Rhizobium leguminosarum]